MTAPTRPGPSCPPGRPWPTNSMCPSRPSAAPSPSCGTGHPDRTPWAWSLRRRGPATLTRCRRRRRRLTPVSPRMLDLLKNSSRLHAPRPYTMEAAADAPPAPGVHVVLDAGSVVYVGYTGNLRSRSPAPDRQPGLFRAARPDRAPLRHPGPPDHGHVVAWLGRRELRWQETDDPKPAKETLVRALQPCFNRQIPNRAESQGWIRKRPGPGGVRGPGPGLDMRPPIGVADPSRAGQAGLTRPRAASRHSHTTLRLPGAQVIQGEAPTECSLPIAMFRRGWCRVTVEDVDGQRAWSNPIYLGPGVARPAQRNREDREKGSSSCSGPRSGVSFRER